MSENAGEIPKPDSGKVHKVLAYSYSLYFFFFLVSVFLDFLFPIRIFPGEIVGPVGIALLILATLLVFWAQRTSRHLEKENLSKDSFRRGPYYFSRNPTHWGLFFLLLGFGLIANAFFVVLFTLAVFPISKIIFVNKQEKILEEKYGAPYLEYKKAVKF